MNRIASRLRRRLRQARRNRRRVRLVWLSGRRRKLTILISQVNVEGVDMFMARDAEILRAKQKVCTQPVRC